MWRALLPFLVLFAFAASGAQAAQVSIANDGWVVAAKARSPEDISLWTRTIPGAELKAFRGAMHVRAPMPSVVALLYDTTNMTKWIFRCDQARIVGEEANGDLLIQVHIEGIWPMGDRDAILRAHPVLNRKTGELVVHGTAVPDYLPPAPGHVRIPALEYTWRITPADGNLTHIEWTAHVDPGGNIPRWLANTLGTLVPRYTLRQVRNLLTDSVEWHLPATQEKGRRMIDGVRNFSD